MKALKHYGLVWLLLITAAVVGLTACDEEKFENIQVYHYTVTCSNSDLKHQYNEAVKRVTNNGYTDYDKNAQVITECDSLYASHRQQEKYRTIDTCTVQIKRQYVSVTEGTGTTRVVSYSYPIK